VQFFTTVVSNVILYATAKAFEESGVVIEEFSQEMEAAEPELQSSVADESMERTDKEVSEFFNVGDVVQSEEAAMEEKEALITDSASSEAPKKLTKSLRGQGSNLAESKPVKHIDEEKKTAAATKKNTKLKTKSAK
jgi:hypothetical protein